MLHHYFGLILNSAATFPLNFASFKIFCVTTGLTISGAPIGLVRCASFASRKVRKTAPFNSELGPNFHLYDAKPN